MLPPIVLSYTRLRLKHAVYALLAILFLAGTNPLLVQLLRIQLSKCGHYFGFFQHVFTQLIVILSLGDTRKTKIKRLYLEAHPRIVIDT